jgi:hypothetical protein
VHVEICLYLLRCYGQIFWELVSGNLREILSGLPMRNLFQISRALNGEFPWKISRVFDYEVPVRFVKCSPAKYLGIFFGERAVTSFVNFRSLEKMTGKI